MVMWRGITGGKQLYSAISRSPTNCALFAWYALFATHKASYSIHYTIIRSADDYRLYSLKCLPLLCLALQQRMFTVLYIAWRAPRDKKHPCDKTPHVAWLINLGGVTRNQYVCQPPARPGEKSLGQESLSLTLESGQVRTSGSKHIPKIAVFFFL